MPDYVFVPEIDAVKTCRWLARTHGYLAGGSTGTVLAALRSQAVQLKTGMTIVAISPDGGEKYLNTIYDDAWVSKTFGHFSDDAQQLVQSQPQLKERRL